MPNCSRRAHLFRNIIPTSHNRDTESAWITGRTLFTSIKQTVRVYNLKDWRLLIPTQRKKSYLERTNESGIRTCSNFCQCLIHSFGIACVSPITSFLSLSGLFCPLLIIFFKHVAISNKTSVLKDRETSPRFLSFSWCVTSPPLPFTHGHDRKWHCWDPLCFDCGEDHTQRPTLARLASSKL